MSMGKNNKVGGCSLCHYKIMGGFQDVSLYGGSDSEKSKRLMIETIYEFVKQMNGEQGDKRSAGAMDDHAKVQYVNSYIKKVPANKKACDKLAAIIDAKIPGRIDITASDSEKCSEISQMLANYADNLTKEQEAVSSSYEQQVLHLRNLVDVSRGFIGELDNKLEDSKCTYKDKATIESVLDTLRRLQEYASGIASQVSKHYDDDFAKYSEKVNKLIKEGDGARLIELIKSNPSDNLNKNIYNLIKILTPLDISTYYVNKALKTAEIDAKTLHSLENQKEFGELVNQKLIDNIKILNTPKGSQLLQALALLQTAFPKIKQHDLESEVAVISGGRGYLEEIEHIGEMLDADDTNLTTQKKLEKLREHLRTNQAFKEDTVNFNLGKLVKNVHRHLLESVLEFVKKIAKKGIVVESDAINKFKDAFLELDRLLSVPGKTIISMYTGYETDALTTSHKSNIDSSIKLAKAAVDNMNLPDETKEITSNLETLRMLLYEVLDQLKISPDLITGGDESDMDLSFADNFNTFQDDLKYYSNINALKSTLNQTQGEIEKYSRNQTELNKAIFNDILITIDSKIEVIKKELLTNKTLSDEDLSSLDVYLGDLRDNVINMYKVAESVDFMLSEFHKKVLMGEMNNSFTNLLKLIENIVTSSDWNINERISSINKMFNTKDALYFSPYLKNALKVIKSSYDVKRMTQVIAYNLYKESDLIFGEDSNTESAKIYKELTKILYLIATQNKIDVKYSDVVNKLLKGNVGVEIIQNENLQNTALRTYIEVVVFNTQTYLMNNINELLVNPVDNMQPITGNLHIVGGSYSNDLLLQLLLDIITIRMKPLLVDGVANHTHLLTPGSPEATHFDIISANRNTANANGVVYNNNSDIIQSIKELESFAEIYLGSNGWEESEHNVDYSTDSSKLSKNMHKLSVLRNMFMIFMHIGDNIDKPNVNNLEIGTMHSIIFQYIVTSTFIPSVNDRNLLKFNIREYDTSIEGNNPTNFILGGHDEMSDIKLNVEYIMTVLWSIVNSASNELLQRGTKIIDSARNPVTSITAPAGAGAAPRTRIHATDGKPVINNRDKLVESLNMLKTNSIKSNEMRFIIYGINKLLDNNVPFDKIRDLLDNITGVDPSNPAKFSPEFYIYKSGMVENGAQDNDSYVIRITQKNNKNLFICDVNKLINEYKTNGGYLPEYAATNYVSTVSINNNEINIDAQTSTKIIIDLLLKSNLSTDKFMTFINLLWTASEKQISNLIPNYRRIESGLQLSHNAINTTTNLISIPTNDPAISYKNPMIHMHSREQQAYLDANFVDAATGNPIYATVNDANADGILVGGFNDQYKQAGINEMVIDAANMLNMRVDIDKLVDLLEYDDDENVITGGYVNNTYSLTVFGNTLNTISMRHVNAYNDSFNLIQLNHSFHTMTDGNALVLPASFNNTMPAGQLITEAYTHLYSIGGNINNQRSIKNLQLLLDYISFESNAANITTANNIWDYHTTLPNGDNTKDLIDNFGVLTFHLFNQANPATILQQNEQDILRGVIETFPTKYIVKFLQSALHMYIVTQANLATWNPSNIHNSIRDYFNPMLICDIYAEIPLVDAHGAAFYEPLVLNLISIIVSFSNGTLRYNDNLATRLGFYYIERLTSEDLARIVWYGMIYFVGHLMIDPGNPGNGTTNFIHTQWNEFRILESMTKMDIIHIFYQIKIGLHSDITNNKQSMYSIYSGNPGMCLVVRSLIAKTFDITSMFYNDFTDPTLPANRDNDLRNYSNGEVEFGIMLFKNNAAGHTYYERRPENNSLDIIPQNIVDSFILNPIFENDSNTQFAYTWASIDDEEAAAPGGPAVVPPPGGPAPGGPAVVPPPGGPAVVPPPVVGGPPPVVVNPPPVVGGPPPVVVPTFNLTPKTYNSYKNNNSNYKPNNNYNNFNNSNKISASLISFIENKQDLSTISNSNNVKNIVPNIPGIHANITNLMNNSNDFKLLYNHLHNDYKRKGVAANFVAALNAAAVDPNIPASELLMYLKYIKIERPSTLSYNANTMSNFRNNKKREINMLNDNLKKKVIMGGLVYDEKENHEDIFNQHKILALLNDNKQDPVNKANLAKDIVLPSGELAFNDGYMKSKYTDIRDSFIIALDDVRYLIPQNNVQYRAIRGSIGSDLETINMNYIRLSYNGSAVSNAANWRAAQGANPRDSIWLDPSLANFGAHNAGILGNLLQLSAVRYAAGDPAPADHQRSSKVKNALLYLGLEIQEDYANDIEVKFLHDNIYDIINMYPIPLVPNSNFMNYMITKNGHTPFELLHGEQNFDLESLKVVNNVIRFMNAHFYKMFNKLVKNNTNSGITSYTIDDMNAAYSSFAYIKNIISNVKNFDYISKNNNIIGYIYMHYLLEHAQKNDRAALTAALLPGAGAPMRYYAGSANANDYAISKVNDIMKNKDLAKIVEIYNNTSQFDQVIFNKFMNAYRVNNTVTPILTNNHYKRADIKSGCALSTLYTVGKYCGNFKFCITSFLKDYKNTSKNVLIKYASKYASFLNDIYKNNKGVSDNHNALISGYKKTISNIIKQQINDINDRDDSFKCIMVIGKILNFAPITGLTPEELRSYYASSLGYKDLPKNLDQLNNNVGGILYDAKKLEKDLVGLQNNKLMKPFSLRKVLEYIKTYPTTAGDSKIDANYIRMTLMLQLMRTAYILSTNPSLVDAKYISNFTKLFDESLTYSQTATPMISLYKYGANYAIDNNAGVPYILLPRNQRLTVPKLLRSSIASTYTYQILPDSMLYNEDLEDIQANVGALAPLNGNSLNAGMIIRRNRIPDINGVLLYDRNRFKNAATVNNNVRTIEFSLKQLLVTFANMTSQHKQRTILGGRFSNTLPTPANPAALATISNEDIEEIAKLYNMSRSLNSKNLKDFVNKFMDFAVKSNLTAFINKDELMAAIFARHRRGSDSHPNFHTVGDRSEVYTSPIINSIYQSNINQFTSSNTLNETLFNVDSLFVNIIKSINARIFEALGLYDLYNHRGIYEKDSGKFLSYKIRNLIGGSSSDEVNPLIADLYVRLPLLALFYKDLFDRAGVSSYKFGIVPDNTGIYGPFIEYIFIRLDDSIKALKDLNNEDVYNIVALCNRIFSSVKNTNDIYKGFIKEINNRYGYINSRMYDEVKDSIRNNIIDKNFEDLDRTESRVTPRLHKLRLPGENSVPSYSSRNFNKVYKLFNYNEKDKVNIDVIKNTIENFRYNLDRKLTDTIESNNFKLKPFINNFKNNLVNNPNDKIAELKEFYNQIDNYYEKSLSPVDVLFTEFVRSGVELLEASFHSIHNLFVSSATLLNMGPTTFNPDIIEDGPIGVIYTNATNIFIKLVNTSVDLPNIFINEAQTIGRDFTGIFVGNKQIDINNFVNQLINTVTVYANGVNYGDNDAKIDVNKRMGELLYEQLQIHNDVPLFLYGNQFMPYDSSNNIKLNFKNVRSKIKDMLDYIVLIKSKFYNIMDSEFTKFYDTKISRLVEFYKITFDNRQNSIVNSINENLGHFNLGTHLNAGTFLIHNSLPYVEVGRISSTAPPVLSRVMIMDFDNLTLLTPIQMFNTIINALFNNFSDLDGTYYYKGIVDAIRSKEINDAMVSPDNSTIADDLSNVNDIYVNKNIISRFIVDKLNELNNPRRDNVFTTRERPIPTNFIRVLDNLGHISESIRSKMGAMIPSFISLLATLVNNAVKVNDLINADYSRLNPSKKELADIILVVNNKIIRSARYTSDNLGLIYKELGSQVNTYMEPYDGFNEQYEKNNHSPHIAPLTFMLYSNGYSTKALGDKVYETTKYNVDKIFPINSKLKNYKFLNAMKIVFSNNVPNPEMFGWLSNTIAKFNEEHAANQITNPEMMSYAKIFVDLCKNNYYMVTNSLIQGRNNMLYLSKEDSTRPANYVPRIKTSINIDQMINILENDDISGYERLKELFRFSYKNMPGKMLNESQSVVANLIEIGIPPINLNEMMKEIPLSTLFNSVYNFDRFVEKNVDYVLKNSSYSQEFIDDFKLYLKNPIIFDKEASTKFGDLNLGEFQANMFVDSAPTSSISILLNYIYNIYRMTILTIQQKMRQKILEKNRLLKGAESFI